VAMMAAPMATPRVAVPFECRAVCVSVVWWPARHVAIKPLARWHAPLPIPPPPGWSLSGHLWCDAAQGSHTHTCTRTHMHTPARIAMNTPARAGDGERDEQHARAQVKDHDRGAQRQDLPQTQRVQVRALRAAARCCSPRRARQRESP
jgi:hypothetical protein